jgi:DNA repair exonuclease SbcCD ATPase subunit
MLLFKKIRFKNLLSYGNAFTEFDLNAHKTTLIYAKNGQGKSVLIDALCLCLYGVPFRKINKPLLLNSINKKQLVVECEFSINNKEFMIRRGMNPDIFEIWIDGKMRDQGAAKDDQEFLSKQILRMNFKSFTQIVVLGSADYIPFMKLPVGTRREVIEEILDIRIFSVMDKILGVKLTDNKEAVTENNYQINNLKQKIEQEKGHLAKIQEDVSSRVAEKKTKVHKYLDDITELTCGIMILKREKDGIKYDTGSKKKSSAKLGKLLEFKGKLEEKKVRIEKEIDFYTTHDSCPVCTQNIDKDFKTNILGEKQHNHDEIDAGLKVWLTQYNETNKVLDGLKIVEAKISKLNDDISTEESKIDVKKQFIKSIEDEIKELETHNQPVHSTDDLLKYQADLALVQSRAEELSKDKKIMDVAGSILKDGGIKSRIIKQYVPIINQLINQFLTTLDFYVNFEFDEQFNEKIKSRYRDEFSYASFSNGQKVRIDLSILIAWRTIAEMRNSTACNLLILDEIFDNSLDVEGTEEFIKLLKNINSNINAFVISPKGDLLVDKFNHSIKVELKNNFSRIV